MNKNQHFLQGLHRFTNLQIVNDEAEQEVKLISGYNYLITKYKDQKQFLIQTPYFIM